MLLTSMLARFQSDPEYVQRPEDMAEKHYRETQDFETFEQFLEYAVQQNCRRDMIGHIRHCGYNARHIEDA